MPCFLVDLGTVGGFPADQVQPLSVGGLRCPQSELAVAGPRGYEDHPCSEPVALALSLFLSARCVHTHLPGLDLLWPPTQEGPPVNVLGPPHLASPVIKALPACLEEENKT